MKVSDLMRAMSEAGAPMEAILIAVQALEAKQAEIDAAEAEKAEKRAKDAARKRAERDAARSVHGQSTDAARTVQADPSLSPFPKENKSNPNPHTHPETKTRARKGHRLPVDWEPKALTGDTAETVTAWPPGAIERELAKFRDWAASANGPNALKKDWDAAWRNWLRKAEEDGRYARKTAGNRDDKRDGAMRALDRQLGLDEPSRQAGRGNAGEGGSYLALASPRTAALR